MRTPLLAAPLLALLTLPAFADEPAPPPPDPLVELQEKVAAQATELELLRAEVEAQTAAAAEDDPIRIYGYIDIGLQRMIAPKDSAIHTVAPSDSTTFVLGNVNLYFDAHPTRRWGTLLELRLTNYPNGDDLVGVPGTAYARTSTQIWDVSAPGGVALVKWGGIVLERAYIEYDGSELFKLRVGMFLTPFGIWNADHGTPTLISLILPQTILGEQFPIHQLGVEALGIVPVGGWSLGYQAYVANGRTPGEVDLTEDKFLGGRLTMTAPRPLALTLGLSFAGGRYSDQIRNLVGTSSADRIETVAYRDLSFGLDAALDTSRFRLRTELAVRVVQYEDGKRETAYGIPGVYYSDHTELDWYALGAFKLTSMIEPYIYFELYRAPSPVSDGNILPSVGLNLHFTHSTQLKLQASYNIWLVEKDGHESISDDYFIWTGARLVQAF